MSCRCHLWIFLVILPFVITLGEAIAVTFYLIDIGSDNFNSAYYALLAVALVPTTWFQITLVRWMVWVYKYI